MSSIPGTLTPSRDLKLLEPYARPLIRNAWYCAAWSEEVNESLFARTILNEPILFYRTKDGAAVALLDVCPHKMAPMHLGVKVGDGVRCVYHGLEFNKEGRCTRNPQGNGAIPPRARLRKYPLVERHGVLWIWMGDANKAIDQRIPDFSVLDDPNRKTLRGGHKVAANYMLMIENLMDLGHALFLHAGSGGLGDYKVTESKITVEGDVVRDQRLYSGFPPPKLFANYLDYGPDAAGISDFWNDVRWSAPSAVLNFSGASRVGQARQSGVNLMGSHFLTPETQNSVHYFYAHSRNYAPDEPAVDEGYRTWQRNALKAEDSAVAEAIQRTMPFVPSLHIDMTLLSTDASGVRVNAILDQMAQAERES